jgi:hypothetical protein
MKYIVGFCIMAFCVNLALNRAVELGDAQGYARGFAEGKRVEPDLSVCSAWWFGGTAGRDRKNEFKQFCKGLK